MNYSQNKHVHIFDFDETLCKTNAEIRIEDTENNIEFFLHPTDYPPWREEGLIEKFPERFVMDFSNFQGYPVYGTPIKGTMSLLKILLTSEEDICVLVTGRDELSGPRAWLLNNGVNVDKMVFLCSGDPNKRMCYESVINTFQPKKIDLYEDTVLYVEQCEEVCKKYEIEFNYKIIYRDVE